MTTSSLSLPRDRRVTLVGVAGFAVALAAAAQVAIPIPGTAVPLTLQPFVVVLAGLWLGPRAAAASMTLYLVAGAAGLPVFAPGGLPGVLRLTGPTGGYLLAYPLAAFVTARLAAPRRERYLGRVVAALAGIAVMYLGGLAQLWALTGSVTSALQVGVLPFVTADVVKAHVAAALARGASPGPRAEG